MQNLIGKLSTEFGNQVFLVTGRYLTFDLPKRNLCRDNIGFAITGSELGKLLKIKDDDVRLEFDGEKVRRRVGLDQPHYLTEATVLDGLKPDTTFAALISGRELDPKPALEQSALPVVSDGQKLLHFIDVRLRKNDFQVNVDHLAFDVKKSSYKRMKPDGRYDLVFNYQIDQVNATANLTSKIVTDSEDKIDSLIEQARRKLILKEKQRKTK
jgi:hypothetical protein